MLELVRCNQHYSMKKTMTVSLSIACTSIMVTDYDDKSFKQIFFKNCNREKIKLRVHTKCGTQLNIVFGSLMC